MDIADWRKRIDAVDQKLVQLLNLRSRYAIKIGRLKAKRSLPIYTPSREVQVLANVARANRGPLDDKAVRRLFERIIDEARGLEREYIEQEARGRSTPSKRHKRA